MLVFACPSGTFFSGAHLRLVRKREIVIEYSTLE